MGVGATTWVFDNVAGPGAAFFDDVAAAETGPALAFFVGDALRYAREAVYAAAGYRFVGVCDVCCRGADDAATACGCGDDVGLAGSGWVLVAVADGAGAFGEEAEFACCFGVVVVATFACWLCGAAEEGEGGILQLLPCAAEDAAPARYADEREEEEEELGEGVPDELSV